MFLFFILFYYFFFFCSVFPGIGYGGDGLKFNENSELHVTVINNPRPASKFQ